MISLREIPFSCFILLTTICFHVVQANQGALSQPRPLYNMKSPNRLSQGYCSRSSPEIFVDNVAEPLLSLLYLREFKIIEYNHNRVHFTISLF